ncbi:hypothetical protein A2U01_0025860, partial [Trifolium medium]|nr:hypothetical protein [Trifolium medium]
MAKAYDRIEWDFLRATLDSMNFPEQMINTIMKATTTETTQMKAIITTYQQASGQLVNYNKSELIFSKRVQQTTKSDIQQILPMPTVDHFAKYLGQPTHIGRSKNQIFNYIQDK